VTLSSPAAAGGTTVLLSSSNAQVGSVPPSVLVPEGQTSASFSIHCAAGAGSATVRGATTNSPAFAASAVFGWSVTSVSGPSAAADGSPASWAVEIDHPAPAGGVVVTLTSTNEGLVTVPATATVPEGRRRIAFATTLGMPRAGSGRIYATLPGSAQSGPFGWTVSALAGPASVGLGAATWTVSINGPAPTGGLVVSLGISDASVASVPASVTVPAGLTSTTFSVNVLSIPTSGNPILSASVNASFVTAPAVPRRDPQSVPAG
jgi:hypothetical protein